MIGRQKRILLSRILVSFLVVALAITPLFGLGQQASAQQQGQDVPESQVVSSISDLIDLVEQLEEDGAFTKDQAAHALQLHLTSLKHFEKQQDIEKVVEHMNGFYQLLDHQRNQGWISEEGHDQLRDQAEQLLLNMNSLSIVLSGQANAVIVIPENADRIMTDMADSLVEYVQKSSGAELQVMTVSDLEQSTGLDELVHIYVGQSHPDDTAYLEDEMADMDDQGFLIYPQENRITITGPTVWGSRNGVYDFLERYVGVRWLFPGIEGEHVPESADILVYNELVREEPHFKHRIIASNLHIEGKWWQRLKLQLGEDRPIRFQEYLYSLFPVEKYGESNPEFYPGGNPPAPGDYHSWQPCLSAKGSAEAAASGIIEYFDGNPDASSFSIGRDANSYSLGINDTSNFCEANPNHPLYPDKLNSVGLPDLSDLYYGWVNDVVEKVLEVHPDKWFGLLAYMNVIDPPSFELHERVVPFVTKDRLAWIDEDVEDYYHQQMDAWNAVASQVGWYDYMYGKFFFVPRVFPHEMEKSFQYAAENNVYGHFIEMATNIGEGPKAYIAAKLLWDPFQDVDEIMEEWYELAVGPAAAEDLAAFFDIWERFWTVDIQQTDWFQNYKWNTYLPIQFDAGYMSAISQEDMRESRRLIDSVVAKAQTEEQQIRAEKFSYVFEYYEASVNSYPLESDPPQNEAEALEMLERVVHSTWLGQKRYDMLEEFEYDPALQIGAPPRINWTGGNGSEFWGLIEYVQAHEPTGGAVTDQVYRFATESENQGVIDSAQLMKDIIAGSQPTLTENHSFEDGNGNAAPWTFWNPNQTASISRVEGVANTGSASILFENAERAGVYDIFDIKPGHSAPAVSYYTPPGTQTDGGVRIVITLRNADGGYITDYISPTIPLSETVGEWATVGLFENIPYEINGQVVAEVLLNAQVFDAQDAQVYLDDVVMYQIESENELPEDDGILNQNSSFELGSNTAPPWGFWLSDSTTGTIERVDGVAHTGNASLLVDHLDLGGPMQTVEVPFDEDITTKISYYTPAGTETNGTIRLGVNVKDANGANLAVFRSASVPLSATVGEWNTLSLTERIPASVNGVDVKNIQIVATIQAQDALVYLDDFEVSPYEATFEIRNGNPSFEIGAKNAPPWQYYLSDSTTGTIERVEGISQTGNASLLVDHLDLGGTMQTVNVSFDDVTTIHVSYYTPEGTETNGTINIVVHAKDAQNNNLVTFRRGAVPLSDTVGEWNTISLTEVIPAAVDGVDVKNIQVIASIARAQDAQIYLDDFEVWN